MSRKTVYGIFDDEEVLLNSVKEIKIKQYRYKRSLHPISSSWTRQGTWVERNKNELLRICLWLFRYNICWIMIYNIMIIDYTMNIGGKPNFTFYHNVPSFVPVMFECTVLFKPLI